MKKKIILTTIVGLSLFLTSCAKDEECVCVNSANLTDSEAKDAGVSLETACELAKIGDETCKIE